MAVVIDSASCEQHQLLLTPEWGGPKIGLHVTKWHTYQESTKRFIAYIVEAFPTGEMLKLIGKWLERAGEGDGRGRAEAVFLWLVVGLRWGYFIGQGLECFESPDLLPAPQGGSTQALKATCSGAGCCEKREKPSDLQPGEPNLPTIWISLEEDREPDLWYPGCRTQLSCLNSWPMKIYRSQACIAAKLVIVSEKCDKSQFLKTKVKPFFPHKHP